MKAKVTLTLDPGKTHRAKSAAKRAGVSMSSWVERLLDDAMDGPTSGHPFTQRWRGAARLRDLNDPRACRLKAKYLASLHENAAGL